MTSVRRRRDPAVVGGNPLARRVRRERRLGVQAQRAQVVVDEDIVAGLLVGLLEEQFGQLGMLAELLETTTGRFEAGRRQRDVVPGLDEEIDVEGLVGRTVLEGLDRRFLIEAGDEPVELVAQVGDDPAR
ncbi:hypothetical protein HPGCJGGD_4413 [Methylobacterium haplocladii]|nr:hypothetical protein HPGCJGGD_4413 [Methylobacterium haplocladii]